MTTTPKLIFPHAAVAAYKANWENNFNKNQLNVQQMAPNPRVTENPDGCQLF